MAIHSSEDFIYHLGNKLKEYQNSDGSIICKDDQTHDHWDHLEACIGLGIAGFKDEFERGLAWSRLNQNSDGSWYEEYKKSNPTKLNKQSNPLEASSLRRTAPTSASSERNSPKFPSNPHT